MTSHFALAGALAVAFAFAGAVAVALAVAGAVAVAFAGAFALAGAGAFAVALAGAGAYALAGAVALAGAGAFAFAGAVAGAVAVLLPALSSGWIGVFEADNISITIFLILLPLLNGLLDFTSWGISRSLGKRLTNNRDSYHALGLAFIDLICAVALLAGLVFILSLSIEALNKMALNKVGDEVFSLSDQIQLVKEEPFGGGLWITVMLLSTLIPTFLHFCIASMSFVLVKTKQKEQAALDSQKIEPSNQKLDGRVKLSTKESGDIAHYWFFHRHLYPILLAVVVIGLVTWGAIEIHLTDSLLAVVDFASSLVRGG